MNTNANFINNLLRRLPQLKTIYDAHLADNEMLLPHVFMGDVARFAIAESENIESRASLKCLLEHFEDGLISGSNEVKELVVVSFVENLIGEENAVKALKPLMGQALKAELKRMCE